MEPPVSGEHHIKFLYTNADQLQNKLHALEIAAKCHQAEVICVTEVKPKVRPKVPLCITDITLPGYSAVGNLSEDGRGIVVYLAHTLHTTVFNPGVIFRDSVWVDILSPCGKILRVGCLYRSDSNDDEANEQLLKQVRWVIENSPPSCEVIIVGDFNSREINWKNQTCDESATHHSTRLLETILDLGLYQHVEKPTRYRAGQTPHTLDLVITKLPESVGSINYDMALGASDHLVLTFDVRAPWSAVPSVHGKFSKRYIYSKGNYEAMRRELAHKDLGTVIEDLSVEDSWSVIKDTLKQLSDRYIPTVRNNASRRKNFKPLWANPKALARVKSKKEAWKRYINSKAGADYERYIEERNAARKEVRLAVRNFEKSIAKKAKIEPKQFWKYARSKTKPQSTIKQLRDGDRVIFTDAEKAELLNDYFSSVFTQEDTSSIPELNLPDPSPPMPDPVITVDDVLKKLREVKADKSPGPDNIPGILLKELASELSSPLCKLFNKSLDTGVVPADWKNANVTAIHKKGEKDLASNYRPISLTSLVCKLQESIIKDHITQHMTENGLSTKVQYGFTKGKSCQSNLIDCIEDWTKVLDKGHCVDVIYLDFKKAFDSVPHLRLLQKLKGYGITGKTHAWVTSFLSGRTQSVVLDGARSKSVPVTSGVPQGSVLGPCLFSIFINDMPSDIDSIIRLFADDSKMYRFIYNPVDCNLLQDDLDKLVRWAHTWQLQFNIQKCCVLRLGKNPPPFRYKMEDETGTVHHLLVVDAVKDLGITISNDLSTKTHVNNVVRTANKVLYTIKRTIKDLNAASGPLLYKSLVRPVLEYANAAWVPHTINEVELLEKVQRRATRWMCARGMDYEARLRYLNLPTLTYRRRRGDVIEVFKYFKNPSVYNSFKFTLSTGVTRGHTLKVLKQRWRTNLGGRALSNRVVNDWNSLPRLSLRPKLLIRLNPGLTGTGGSWTAVSSLEPTRVVPLPPHPRSLLSCCTKLAHRLIHVHCKSLVRTFLLVLHYHKSLSHVYHSTLVITVTIALFRLRDDCNSTSSWPARSPCIFMTAPSLLRYFQFKCLIFVNVATVLMYIVYIHSYWEHPVVDLSSSWVVQMVFCNC